jgi:hypothetical protein
MFAVLVLLLTFLGGRAPSAQILRHQNDLGQYRLVVPFLTCAATCWRNPWYIAPFISRWTRANSTVYSYVLSDSLAALNTTRAGILTPLCTGGRVSSNGNACRYDVAFRHFFQETNGTWLLVAIDDTYLNERNLFRLLDMLEELYDPRVDMVSTGQVHHDWGTNYPHGGSGLLYSRAWVDEFFRRNFSFEAIHANNYRYTYDIATGLINLNYFDKAIWIEHPWLCVVSPDGHSFDALVKKTWNRLQKCPPNRRLVRLRDVAQFHISPFNKETAGFVKDLEFAPEQVHVWRPTSYGVTFCWSSDSSVTEPFVAESLKKYVLDLPKMNENDVSRRMKLRGTHLPW